MTVCNDCRTTILSHSNVRERFELSNLGSPKAPPKTWGYHHGSPDVYLSSVEQNCVFCIRLTSEMKKANVFSLWQDGQESKRTEAMYRWSVRKTPKIRETQGAISVTFRPVPDSDRWEELLHDVTFFFIPDEAESHMQFVDEIGNNTSSDESWKQVKKWIETCKNEHPDCHQQDLSFKAPTRLLYIGPKGGSALPQTIKLIESANHTVKAYMTLSHRWGDARFIQLNQKNKHEYLAHGIPLDSFDNKNFTDAMRIAQHLDIEYIWIDSLCIVQGDRDDWLHEASLMQDVYRFSYCNIAASNSEDVSDGIFHRRESTEVAISRYDARHCRNTGIFDRRSWRIVPGDYWRTNLLNNFLYTRGWVFQERMLAPRILHYTSGQIFWDCASMSACETLPSGIPRQVDAEAYSDRGWRRSLQTSKRPVDDASLRSFWVKAMHTYTSCDLTNHSDKLVAMQGIATRLSLSKSEYNKHLNHRPVKFIQGLWAGAFIEDLSWKVSNWKTARRQGHDRKGQLQFPSWSWASMAGSAVELPEERPQNTLLYLAATQLPIKHRGQFDDSTMVFTAKGILGATGLIQDLKTKEHFLCFANEGFKCRAYPDIPLDTETEHEFLILFASRKNKPEYTPTGEIIHQRTRDDTEQLIDGYGLLIEKCIEDPSFYIRTGLVEFSELSQEQWMHICNVCGHFPQSLEPEFCAGRDVVLR